MSKGRGPARNEPAEQVEEPSVQPASQTAIVRPRDRSHHPGGTNGASTRTTHANGDDTAARSEANGDRPPRDAAPPAPPPIERPRQEIISDTGALNLKALKGAKITELAHIAREYNIEGAANMRKQEMIFSILQAQAQRNGSILGEGVLEILPDGFGFLRAPDYN